MTPSVDRALRPYEAANDEPLGLTLALIEVLAEKLMPGSFQKILAKEDVAKVMAKKEEFVAGFAKAREKKARGLVLPGDST